MKSKESKSEPQKNLRMPRRHRQRRLRLSTIGILQYIAPTLIMLVAVFIFDEPFGRARAIAFPMIWAALVIYSWSMLRQMRKPKVG